MFEYRIHNFMTKVGFIGVSKYTINIVKSLKDKCFIEVYSDSFDDFNYELIQYKNENPYNLLMNSEIIIIYPKNQKYKGFIIEAILEGKKTFIDSFEKINYSDYCELSKLAYEAGIEVLPFLDHSFYPLLQKIRNNNYNPRIIKYLSLGNNIRIDNFNLERIIFYFLIIIKNVVKSKIRKVKVKYLNNSSRISVVHCSISFDNSTKCYFDIDKFYPNNEHIFGIYENENVYYFNIDEIKSNNQSDKFFDLCFELSSFLSMNDYKEIIFYLNQIIREMELCYIN